MEKRLSTNHKHAFAVFNHLVICRVLFNHYQQRLKTVNSAVNFINALKIDQSRIIRIIKEDTFIANSLSLIIQNKINVLSDKQLIILFDVLSYRLKYLERFCQLLQKVQIRDEKLIKCIEQLNDLTQSIMIFCGDKFKKHDSANFSMTTLNGPSLNIQQKKLTSKDYFYSLKEKDVKQQQKFKFRDQPEFLFINGKNHKQRANHMKVPSISISTLLQHKHNNDFSKVISSTFKRKTRLRKKNEQKESQTMIKIDKNSEIQHRSSSCSFSNKRFIHTATTKATDKRPGSSFIKDIKRKFYHEQPKSKIKKHGKKIKFATAIHTNQNNEKKKSINIQPQSKKQIAIQSKNGEKCQTFSTLTKRNSILPNKGGYNLGHIMKGIHKKPIIDISERQNLSSQSSSQQNVEKKQFQVPIYHHRNAFFSKHTYHRNDTVISNTPIKIKDQQIKSQKKILRATTTKPAKNSNNQIFRSSGYDSRISKRKFSKKDNVTQLRRKACALTEIVEFDGKNLQQYKNQEQNKQLENQFLSYDKQTNKVKFSEIFSLHQDFKQVNFGTYTPKINKNFYNIDQINESMHKIRNFIIPISELFPNRKLANRIKTDPHENLGIDAARCFIKKFDHLQQKNLEIERDWDRDLEIMDFYY